jgi:hypothetical protein
MKAASHTDFSVPVADNATAEVVIWELPDPVRGSAHLYKYRLALIVDDVCVLRYDNEAGKGDHKHLGNRQLAYDFRSVDDLQIDFWKDVEEWLIRKKL